MPQLQIKDIVSDALRLIVREPRVFLTWSWASLLVSTAMFMSAYLAQGNAAKKAWAAVACILQTMLLLLLLFDAGSLSRLTKEVSGAPPLTWIVVIRDAIYPLSESLNGSQERLETG